MNQYIDYEVLEDKSYLLDKNIVIYGAGNYGRQSAEMLCHLGVTNFNFCDRDVHKQGMELMGGKIFSITEIEKTENLLVVIAVGDMREKKAIEQSLQYIKEIQFLSFFALKAVWKYLFRNYENLESRAALFTLWYEQLTARGNLIKKACKSSVLVYQNGKVGSSSISESLSFAGIEHTHLHRLFFKNDVVGEMILGEKYAQYVRESNIFSCYISQYMKDIKDSIRNRKIITLVREPIAVDLSTVFQWIGDGITDRFFAEEMRQGNSFIEIVSELMMRIQDRLFDWFNDELKELCNIDIFAYPFDKEKGYAVISENMFDILLIKAEKLSQMGDVIGAFLGGPHIEMIDANVGKDKEYAYLYEKVKKNLVLSEEYVENYYCSNIYVDHFYTEDEKKYFRNKWTKCAQENGRENHF